MDMQRLPEDWLLTSFEIELACVKHTHVYHMMRAVLCCAVLCCAMRDYRHLLVLLVCGLLVPMLREYWCLVTACAS